MFSIEQNFSDADLERWIQEDLDAWFDELINYWKKRGRELVDKARAKSALPNGFNNITWNLRSSIGMCIINEKGEIIDTYFPQIGKGKHGDKVGRELAEKIAIYGREADEISMVFVAGEEYAGFVQAKGKDVIGFVIGLQLGEALKEIM